MQLQQPCEPRAAWGRQSRAAGEDQHNGLPQGTAGLHGLSLPPATPAKALLALAQFVPGLSLWPELNSACAGHQHSDHHSLTVHAMSWQCDMGTGAPTVALSAQQGCSSRRSTGSGTHQGRANPHAWALHGHAVPALAVCCQGCAGAVHPCAREGWCSGGIGSMAGHRFCV